MLSSASLTNLAEPEPEPEQLASPSSTRGLAYSLPLRCVSVDSDGKTLRASGSRAGERQARRVCLEQLRVGLGRC